MSRIYSYVITHDFGFAPNPFGGICTLATCKPAIRMHAKEGSWLVGTGSARAGLRGKLIYAAKIHTVCTLEQYGLDPQYAVKIPSSIKTEWSFHGDNIYVLDEDGRWYQRSNPHHDESHITRDLKGLNVLVSKEFWYFGAEAKLLPDDLQPIVKAGPGHKCTSSAEVILRLEQWLLQFDRGVTGKPNPFHSEICGSCTSPVSSC